MSIFEFRKNINLLRNFTFKMNKENVPYNIRRILVKVYAHTLKINLTDRMADDILLANWLIYPVIKSESPIENAL